jgi:predicted nicotinamide N-methyase
VHTPTIYEGPIEESNLRISGRDLRLLRPADPDRLLNDPSVLDLNRRDDYMPYWAYLWPGAYLLAEAVGSRSWDSDAGALEIGCGLGLAGLSALLAGLGRVDFTDYDEAPLRFVEQSAAANQIDPSRISTRRLDWRAIPEGEQHDLILGADVLYERRLVPLVTNLLHTVLAPGGLALVAGPYRVATEDFAPCLKAHSLRCEIQPVTATDLAGRPIRGTLHRIWR